MYYDINGRELTKAYDISGNIIYTKPKDPYISNRLLIFEDDFDGEELDFENWQKEIGHIRGPAYGMKREPNVTVRNSILTVVGKPENHLTYTWGDGGITSRCRKMWGVGRFEAKMKMPEQHSGAFWFMGATSVESYTNDDGTIDYPVQSKGIEGSYGWAECGEIDVVESWSRNQNSHPQCNIWDSTIGASGASLGHGTFPNTIDSVNEWHIYAMEKTPDYIAMFIDDIEYKRWTFANMDRTKIWAYVDLPISIIIGLGVGGDTTFNVPEVRLQCDWVRIYAPEGTVKPVIETSIQVQETYRMRKGWKSFMPVKILPMNASDMTVKWVSEDESIVRADGGYLYAEELGEVDVHAITKHGLRATCHITVVPPEDIPVG